jgi:hypothetical protein
VQGLNKLGYRVFKKEEHERLLVAAAQRLPSKIAVSPQATSASPSAPDPQITSFTSILERADVAKLLERLKGSCHRVTGWSGITRMNTDILS